MTKLQHLQEEYRRVMEDRQAMENLPKSVKPTSKFYETLRWLDMRLSNLEESIAQEAA